MSQAGPSRSILAVLAGLAVGVVVWMAALRDGSEPSVSKSEPAPVQSAAVPTGDDEEADVRAVVERSFVNPEAANCDEIYTERLLRWAAHEESLTAARGDCRESEEESIPAGRVTYGAITVEAPQATAVVRVHGGDQGGHTLTMSLLSDEDGWRIDRLTAATIHRPEFDRSMRAALVARSVPDREAGCVVRRLLARGEGAYTTALIDDGANILGERAAEACLTRQGLVDVGLSEVRKDFEAKGLPGPFIDCAIAGMRRLFSHLSRRQLTADEMPPGLRRKAEAIGAACAKAVGLDRGSVGASAA